MAHIGLLALLALHNIALDAVSIKLRASCCAPTGRVLNHVRLQTLTDIAIRKNKVVEAIRAHSGFLASLTILNVTPHTF